MSPNRAARAEAYGRLGRMLTAEAERQREWRVALGQSPNPWRGEQSRNEEGAGPQVMQISTRTRLSKLQLRSLAESAVVEKETP